MLSLPPPHELAGDEHPSTKFWRNSDGIQGHVQTLSCAFAGCREGCQFETLLEFASSYRRMRTRSVHREIPTGFSTRNTNRHSTSSRTLASGDASPIPCDNGNVRIVLIHRVTIKIFPGSDFLGGRLL